MQLLKIIVSYTVYSFYFFIKNKMPVFADVLPEPWVGSVSLYSSSLNFWLFLVPFLLIWLALFVFWIICLRKIFNKAWLHWRWSLIPVYREYLRFKMVWRNGRWTASLFCLPMFAIVLVISYFKAAEKFSKDKEQFGMWLRFLNPIFLWILAFDESKYQK